MATEGRGELKGAWIPPSCSVWCGVALLVNGDARPPCAGIDVPAPPAGAGPYEGSRVHGRFGRVIVRRRAAISLGGSPRADAEGVSFYGTALGAKPHLEVGARRRRPPATPLGAGSPGTAGCVGTRNSSFFPEARHNPRAHAAGDGLSQAHIGRTCARRNLSAHSRGRAVPGAGRARKFLNIFLTILQNYTTVSKFYSIDNCRDSLSPAVNLY
jgi:hypothetical protein